MTVRSLAHCLSELIDQAVTRGDRLRIGTWMPRKTPPVHFPRGDAGYPHMRALRAPDRPVPVPNRNGGAIKCCPGRDDGG